MEGRVGFVNYSLISVLTSVLFNVCLYIMLCQSHNYVNSHVLPEIYSKVKSKLYSSFESGAKILFMCDI